MKFWQKIKEFKQRLDSHRGAIEFNNDGFELKWQRWPIREPYCERKVRWEDVLKIDVCMWDCFAGHSVGLFFEDGTIKSSKKKWICVIENREGYKEFTKYVSERFSGFNSHNVQEIERCCPCDLCFPCWDRYAPVDDLEFIPEKKIVVWKKDGKIFAG